MPFSPKQPCARPGCGALVDRGRCAACADQGHGASRQSANERGYTYRWQKASRAYLQQNPWAVDWFGDHNGRRYLAEVVDHIVPHKGDMEKFWSVSNWQGLTFRDHSRKTALEGSFGRPIPKTDK